MSERFHTEYCLQFKFKPKGIWIDDTETRIFYEREVAEAALESAIAQSKLMKNTFPNYALYWRVAKRTASDWEAV